MNRTIIAVAALAFHSVAFAGWFGPSNYDECILENMKGVGDRAAAGQIIQACARKFPSPAPKPVETVAPSPTPCPDANSIKKNGKEWSFVPNNCIPTSKEQQRKLRAAGYSNFTSIPDDGK